MPENKEETLNAALAASSPADLVRDISLVESGDTPETVLEVLHRAEYYAKCMNQVKTLAKQMVIDWIETNGQIQYEDLDGNTIRYYVGETKTTKLKPDSKAQAIMAILDATAGDLDGMAGLLSAQPIKHGAAKKVLTEEVWADLFETVATASLKEGAPKRELQTVNSKFLR